MTKFYDQDQELPHIDIESDPAEPGGLPRVGGFELEAGQPFDAHTAKLGREIIQIDSRESRDPDPTPPYGSPRRLPGARSAKGLANLYRHQNAIKRI